MSAMGRKQTSGSFTMFTNRSGQHMTGECRRNPASRTLAALFMRAARDSKRARPNSESRRARAERQEV